MSQHFTLFQLEPAFDIDTAALEQTYRSLAARFHPDRHAAASAFEQKQAMMMASAVNEAYRILKNPIDRAAYLLEQHNIHADSPEHTSFPPEFLMQQMEWREALEDAATPAAVDALEDEVMQARKAGLARCEALIDHQGDYPAAAQQVRALMFIARFADDIDRRREQLGQ